MNPRWFTASSVYYWEAWEEPTPICLSSPFCWLRDSTVRCRKIYSIELSDLVTKGSGTYLSILQNAPCKKFRNSDWETIGGFFNLPPLDYFMWHIAYLALLVAAINVAWTQSLNCPPAPTDPNLVTKLFLTELLQNSSYGAASTCPWTATNFSAPICNSTAWPVQCNANGIVDTMYVLKIVHYWMML